MAEHDRIDALVEALADGNDVDWTEAESTAKDEWERAVIRRLGRIGQVADLQRRSRIRPATTASGAEASPDGAAASIATWSHLVLLERIGEGTFGEVFRAHDPRLARDVALKLLYEPVSGSGPQASAAIEEGRLLARVRHPNAVTVHGADRVEGRVGVWMDFIKGRTLEQVLREHGPLGPQEATLIGLDLCRALAAVHQAGLVHGDVKAQNVMREDGGRVVLMDFGAGRDRGDVTSGHALTPLAGTPLYLAPELLRGSGASARSDLYSLGVLLYHLVTNAYPIAARTRVEIEEAHALGHRIRLRDARPDLPAGFVQVVERALSPDPEARYGSAGDMEAALAEAAVRPAGVDDGRSGPGAVRYWWKKGWAAAAAFVVLALAAVAMVVSQRSAPIPFEARDQILVAAFDNTTGETQLDGVVEAALEYELVNSPFVTVVPRTRVDHVLTLMRRPVETRLETGIARELAQRDGAIRAVLGGRVDRLGPGYALTASVMAPASGAVYASLREEAATATDLPRALRRLANSLRESLGEAPVAIHESEVRLEKVMTPSLQALKWYSQSYALGNRDNWSAALEFARRAVDADPEFASAQIWLAWCLHRNQPRTFEADVEREAVAARAVELARHAPDWERYWIEGSQLIMFNRQEHRDAAAAKYKALLEIVPTHHWGLGNLMIALGPRRGEAVPYVVAAVERQPNDLRLVLLAFRMHWAARETDRAEGYADRIRQLSRGEGVPVPVDVLQFPAVAAFVRGDVASSVRELDALDVSLSGLAAPLRDQAARFVVDRNLGLGRPSAARRVIATLADANEREFQLATTAWAADNLPALREHISRVPLSTSLSDGVNRNSLFQGLFLRVSAGLLSQVDAYLLETERLSLSATDRAGFNLVRACVSQARQDPDEAIAWLARARSQSSARLCWGEECEADARAQRGEIDEAVKSLQWWDETQHNELPPGALRIRTHLRLAELYHAAGREQAARSLADVVARALSQAEPDFPLLARLKRLQQGLGPPRPAAVAH